MDSYACAIWFKMELPLDVTAAWLAHCGMRISATGNSILLLAVRNTGTAWHQPVDAVVGDSGTLLVNNRELNLSTGFFVVTADGLVTYHQPINSATSAALLAPAFA